jgi:opacity protein-like surface antigen
VLLGIAMAVVSVAPAAAQTPPALELSGGYQFIHLSGDEVGGSLGKGWYVDLAANLSRELGVVFQVGGSYRSIDESQSFMGTTVTSSADIAIHEYMGGLRFNLRRTPTIVPFAHFLAGAVHGSVDVEVAATSGGVPIFSFGEEESSTNFGLQLGGGANVRLTDAIGARVGLDYLRIFADDGGGNVFRFSAGVVFALMR